MTSQRRPYLAVAVAIAVLVLLGADPIFAQKGNETGLPLYPNTNTGKQYPPSPEGYAIYTCQSPDTLAAVEEWYRHALNQRQAARLFVLRSCRCESTQLEQSPASRLAQHCHYIHGPAGCPRAGGPGS